MMVTISAGQYKSNLIRRVVLLRAVSSNVRGTSIGFLTASGKKLESDNFLAASGKDVT